MYESLQQCRRQQPVAGIKAAAANTAKIKRVSFTVFSYRWGW